MPPTEKKGRRHSSDVTVVWLDKPVEKLSSYAIPAKDVKEDFIRTSGPGGQNKNKVSSCVRLTHLPTGLQIVADGERTQYLNRQVAWRRLEEKLLEAENNHHHEVLNNHRSQNFGGEKLWVWTEWRDTVTSPAGKTSSYAKALKGNLGRLLKE